LTVFALVGLGASSASMWVHWQLLHDTRYTSFCDVTNTVSCSEAYLSPWGSLFGVPVALFGLLFFVAVLGLLLAERRAAPPVRQNIPGYVFAMSAVGLVFVLYLAYGAFFVLGAVCLLCIVTYVAVIGLLLVAGSASALPTSSLPARALRDLRSASASPLALAVIIIFFAGAASAIAFFPRETVGGDAPDPQAAAAPAAQLAPEERTQVEGWFDAQPRNMVPIDPKGATVLIVKFNDYQCPPCRQTHFDYKPILDRWEKEAPGQVRMVTRDFPIHPTCNAATPAGTHRLACDAAVAVRLAREQSKDTAMEDWIFTNQASLTADSIRKAAREIGGVTDFDARFPKVLEDVRSDAAMGALMQVRATPTFFINGVKIDGGMPPKYFDAIIAHELKKRAK
jgi:uncharacterized membrane protein/predicted DsbA family dithiol-disulfide isomerase